MRKNDVKRSMFLICGILITGWFIVQCGYVRICAAAENEKKQAASQYLSDNLILNGGFEAVDENNKPKNWTIVADSKKPDVCVIEADSTVKHKGKNSLKVMVKENVESVALAAKSIPFTPQPGRYYRVSGWVRQENLPDGYCGFSSIHMRGFGDYWTWRVGIPSGSFDWKFFDKLMGPAEDNSELALSLGLYVYKGKPTVWFDDFRLQEYNPPPVPANPKKWVYAGKSLCTGGHIVDDADAAGGKAYKITASDGAGTKCSGASFSDQPAGLYRAVFRMKVSDISKDYVIGDVGMILLSTGGFSSQRMFSIHDFKEPNKYQDVTVDFILPVKGILPMLEFFTAGSSDVSIDTITVVQLVELTDESMQEFYGD